MTLVIAAAAQGAPAAVSNPAPGPAEIFGGQVVEPCAWPTAVAVSGGNSLCTGTLIHPRVVMFAAHCGASGNKKILFGEDVASPKKSLSPDLCMVNPEYGGVNDQGRDWAFCRLSESVTDLPITPVVFGCEKEIVFDNQMAAITGFGITTQDGKAGVKNWALTPIRKVYSTTADVGGFDDPGICPGDSGGPALVKYPDGSWHAFGIASTLTGQCGGVGTHSLAWNAVPWIEEMSGIDVTPCHDIDGTWNPTLHCTGFYAGEAGVGVGSWLQWCPETPKNGSSATCGAAFDAEPDNTPPTVAITTPDSGDYPDDDVFTTSIEVDADDGDGWGVAVVRLKINGKEQPLVDDQAPYAFATVNFPKGSYELIAVAEDAAGLISESAPVLITVGPQAPGETGDETSDAGSSEGESGPTPTTSGEGGETSDPSATATATAPTSASDTAETQDTAPVDGGEDGCGCRSEPRAAGAAWLLLAFVGVCRRRRATFAA